MSNYQDLSNFMLRICNDVFRELFRPHYYGDGILPFVVLRRMVNNPLDFYNKMEDTKIKGFITDLFYADLKYYLGARK